MAIPRFYGVIPPVPTLFTEDEQLDEASMANLLDSLIASDVNGLFFLGSAGEFAHMSEALRLRTAEFCVNYVDKRKPVLIGIAHSGTREAIRFGLHAQKIGADGVVAVNPFYNPLSEENLYLHYKHLADALSLPILIYNFPALTGQSIPVPIVRRLAETCPNIVGLKDTVDTLSHIRETIHAVKPVRPDFAVFSGYDEYLFGTLILGGDGCIPASANFAPQLTCGIYRAWQEQDYAQAVKLQQRLSYIPELYNYDLPFYNAVKYAIKLVGVDISVNSLWPASPLTDELKEKVRGALARSGVI
ncbi:dihydrodipicolinate synthase family protein [Acerihabitans arboris]|uniref:Dihydrodipicolinate synthase family protein n=1 Tax=Acerihabitans arboris TaxID=2691583 RepID=A0A845SRN3_9GAMM|nr:dihydrodipicolinate synthase family protein [Acerihabitans arboris]NDL66002.1 dihydrodipicolinate synthase family protein [Acerihabitans arboris]